MLDQTIRKSATMSPVISVLSQSALEEEYVLMEHAHVTRDSQDRIAKSPPHVAQE